MKEIRDWVVLVTGATDGIGRASALTLAKHGATVLLHGRDPHRLKAVEDEIRAETPGPKVETYLADFSSLAAVRRMADEVIARRERLDVLINNAGIGSGRPVDRQRQLSQDGYELRFAVNYLAHFALTLHLLLLLRKAAPSRIVNVASAGQQRIDFSDVMLERGYSGGRAYAQSKLAMILFTIELAEQLKNQEISVNSLHPGTYLDTGMVNEAGITPLGTPQSGADAILALATSSQLEGVTGEYFDRTRLSRADAQAYDPAARRRLWELSERLTGSQLRGIPELE